MIRLFFILLIIFLVSLGFSQERGYSLSVSPTAGYEMNMLKSPSTFLDSNGVESGRQELWQNAPFVGVGAKYTTFGEGKRHNFSMGGYFDRALFLPANIKAGEVSAIASYKYHGRNFWNQWSIGYRDFQRTGRDEDNLIGAPLSYRRFSLRGTFDIKTGKKSHLIIKPFGIAKYYQRPGFERFMYFDNGLQTTWAYRYKFKRKVGFAFDAGFHQRNYRLMKQGAEVEDDEFEFDDIEFEEEDLGSERIWRYYSGGYGMRFPINEHFKITSRVGYAHRSDALQGSLGYNQYSAEVGLGYKRDKFKASLNLSSNFRHYTDFAILGQLLNYQYYNYDLRLRYAFTKRFSAQLSTAGKLRLSNIDLVNRRSVRSYFITQFKVSVIWTFKGKYSQGSK